MVDASAPLAGAKLARPLDLLLTEEPTALERRLEELGPLAVMLEELGPLAVMLDCAPARTACARPAATRARGGH